MHRQLRNQIRQDLVTAMQVFGDPDCSKMPEVFFPEDEHNERAREKSIQIAKTICAGCPIRRNCLEFAIAYDEPFGVWGGLTHRERARFTSKDVLPESARDR